MEKFYFFNSFLDTARAIEDEKTRLEYMMAVAEYGIEGKESDNPIIKALMVQTKFVLDRSKEMSEQKSEKMKGNKNAVKNWGKQGKQTKTEKNREKQKKQEEEVEVEEEYKEIGDNKLSHKESEDAFMNVWNSIPTAKGGNEKEGRKMYEQKIQNGMSGEMMYKLASLSKFEIREKVKEIMYSQKKENWIRDVCPQTDDEMEARIVDILKARYKRKEEGTKFKVNTVAELGEMFGNEYIGKLWKDVQVEARKRFNL